jgi:hypothetical protein
MRRLDAALAAVHDRLTRAATDQDPSGVLTKKALRDAEELAALTDPASDLDAAYAAATPAWPAVPAARLRRGLGRAAALGLAHRRSRPGDLEKQANAGAYMFGRYTSRLTVHPGGTVHTAITERPRADWPVLIKGHGRRTAGHQVFQAAGVPAYHPPDFLQLGLGEPVKRRERPGQLHRLGGGTAARSAGTPALALRG